MELSTTFLQHFSEIDDPRLNNHRNKQHLLDDMLVITILAVICGAENWVDIEEFGQAKLSWLSTFLTLPNGIPSHDTFGRLFSLLDPEQLQQAFLAWVRSLVESTQGEIIAIDGKTLRRSFDKGKNRGAIHMISAWAVNNALVLGQVKTDEKSNEITAIPKLLDLLDLTESIVTIDAMGCQQAIAQKIIDKNADYVLSLKANQGTLYTDVKELFTWASANDFKRVTYDYEEDVTKDHGRIETRRYWLISAPDTFSENSRWPGLKGLGISQCTREIAGEESTEYRFYLLSFSDSAKRFAQAARNHWQVEINLHWSLDVSFHEDLSRARTGHSAENLSVIRRIALNLLKKENSKKIGIAAKRKKAGWDHNYLLKVLASGD